ncbi:MAG: hypothetical protein NTW10_00735 [Bacteroidetes bacterium]|nr:hypothetical protein [Bacteroidota bacterium]
MKKFLIEVPHDSDKHSCEHAIQVFRESGSHYLTRAEWGCMDGEHKSWIIVEVDSKEEARSIVPPLFRSVAKIIQLVTFASIDSMTTEKFHA